MRLIVDAPADGAANMAVDETLLDSASRPDGAATLRLYRFRTPTITFGYAQAGSDAVDSEACERLGVDRVRRITGGRALLHQHELTYCFTSPPLARSVKSVYRMVAGALRTALERVGVPIDPPPRAGSSSRAPAYLPCLAVATGHEITARGGDKLVASAMRFRRHGFLQHGSILWSVDHEYWKRLTRLGDRAPLRAVGVRELGASRVEEGQLVDALSGAFSELVGDTAVEATLTTQEAEFASTLEQKYRSRAWTDRRIAHPISIG